MRRNYQVKSRGNNVLSMCKGAVVYKKQAFVKSEMRPVCHYCIGPG